MKRIVIVPGLPALLPAYTSLVDPIPDLRAAVTGAVEWLIEDGAAVSLRADPADERIGDSLLDGVPRGGDERLLVVANGSARRGEKAPGHLDERSFAYDDALGAALAAGDVTALRELDLGLGDDLLCAGISCLQGLPDGDWRATVDWSGDPFGVQYWVVRWEMR